ncbi:MAG: nucleoside-triphosphatase [Eubacterium sp.]|nr:nucleoside-triphosphatase [Eubacterium sp.]
MEHEIKHIFLTGEKQVGKSTVLGNVLDALQERGYRVGGFQTLPFFIDGNRRGFYLHSLGDTPEGMNDIPVAVCFHSKKGPSGIGITEAFNRFGAGMLKDALDNADILWMDELGRLEGDAYEFNKTVVECLDRAPHVIGVLQKVKRAFLQEIALREDVMVIEVTTDNRNEMANMVLDALGAM